MIGTGTSRKNMASKLTHANKQAMDVHDEPASYLYVQQLIYTRVEAEFSPSGRSGFQTVYHSNLDTDLINAIERRIRCFYSADEQAIRLQFFILPNNTVVLSHTCAIKGHARIVDKSQRPGVFLVHCLIIDLKTFQAIAESNPFTLFDNAHSEEFSLYTDPEIMIDELGCGTTIIPRAMIPLKLSCRREFTVSSFNDAVSLLSRSVPFGPSSGGRRPLVLHVSLTDIVESLRLMFYLLPEHYRLYFTFDTHVDRCPVNEQSFWAVGTTELRRRADLPVVTLGQKPAHVASFDKQRIYESYIQWLEYEYGRRRFPTLIDWIPQGQILINAYEQQDIITYKQVKTAILDDFFAANHDFFQMGIQNLLKDVLTVELAQELQRHIMSTYEKRQMFNLIATRGCGDNGLADVVVSWLGDHHATLGNGDWARLRRLADRYNNPVLLFIASTACKHVQERERQLALRNMGQRAYKTLLSDWFMDPIAPACFVNKTYAATLINKVKDETVSSTQLVDLIDTLIKCGGTARLALLIKNFNVLDASGQRRLERLISRKRKTLPQRFVKAVDNRSEKSSLRKQIQRFLPL